MLAPSSPGDVLDRLTILDLKRTRIADPARAAIATAHARALEEAWRAEGLPPPSQVPEHDDLATVNAALWDVEDRLRAHEARGDFGPAFVEGARSVYRLNDERARLKAAVDRRFGAQHPEVKSYGGEGDPKAPEGCDVA